VTIPGSGISRRRRSESTKKRRETGGSRAQTVLQKQSESALATVERNPGDAQAQLQLGSAIMRRPPGGAEHRAEIAVGLRRRSEPLLVLADILQHGRHTMPMRAYQAAPRIMPDDPRPRVGLAYLYILFAGRWKPRPAEAGHSRCPPNPQMKVSWRRRMSSMKTMPARKNCCWKSRDWLPDDASSGVLWRMSIMRPDAMSRPSRRRGRR